MKKILALALVMILALSLLISCGGGNNNGNSGNDENSILSGDIDLSSIIGGIGKPSDYNAAARQAMIDAARMEGGDLEFKADGSMIYTDPDGSVTIQNADGTWTYQDSDGSTASAQIGGDWPDNEFTKLLPRPDFTVSAAVDSGESFTVTFSGVAIEKIKAYVEQVKTAGFDINADTEDDSVMGMVIYNYSAQNKTGYEISVFSASGVAGLSITKP